MHLPINKPWYRNLLIFSILLGVVGALWAVAYTFITDEGIDFFFGGTGSDWWDGRWWWIPLVSLGGFLVSKLRDGWNIPKNVPGGVETLKNADVEPTQGMQLVLISVVSVIFGAALGPSFGFILLGGLSGSWLYQRFNFKKSRESVQEYNLTGMAGALGGAFSAPLFGAIMVSEGSPTKKEHYVRAFLPQIIAAIIGYLVFFGITGSTILGLFELPGFDYEPSQIITATALGVIATLILVVFAFIAKFVNVAMSKIKTPQTKGVIGGAVLGLIVFALPLTAGAGTSQLNVVLETPAAWSIAFLITVLVGKMIAITISLESGFLGGNVFPIIFIGGVAGVIIHSINPEISLSLAVASMLTAVPGAFLRLPITLIILTAGTMGLVATSTIPLAVSYVVAHLSMSLVRHYVSSKKQTESST